jgi:hypothetical protein
VIANLRCLCVPARAIHALQSAAVTAPRAQRGSTTKPSAGPHDPSTFAQLGLSWGSHHKRRAD